MKIAVLASGNLGLKCIQELTKEYVLQFIATDSSSIGIIDYAQQNSIPCFKGNPRNGKLYAFANGFKTDILFSINYLFIIEKDIISLAAYPLNFHGSLLPKYRGRTPHIWAIINNEKTTGVTAHLIDEGCDTGDIILQETIEINGDETGNDILQKYVALYPEMIRKIISQIQTKSLQIISQQNELATYYGKRTPDDGEIDWEWQKERIKNWVRAQAYPYPGAFTYINDNKIIIDKIEFSDLGYTNNIANGTVLKVQNKFITVKTPNGAIVISGIRNLNIGNIPSVGSKLGNKSKQTEINENSKF